MALCLVAPNLSGAARLLAVCVGVGVICITGFQAYQRLVDSYVGAPVDLKNPIPSNTIRRWQILWIPIFAVLYAVWFALFGYILFPALLGVLSFVGVEHDGARSLAVFVLCAIGFPFINVAICSTDTVLAWLDKHTAGPRND